MFVHKYQPFRQTIYSHAVVPNKKIEDYTSLTALSSFKQNPKVVLLSKHKHSILVVSSDSLIHQSERIQQLSSNFVPVSETQIAYYQHLSNSFRIFNTTSFKTQLIPRQQLSEQVVSSLKLLFFKNTNTLCLMEMSQTQNKSKLKWYQYSKQKMEMIREQIIDQAIDENTIFKLNQNGLIAWLKGDSSILSLNLFNCQHGYRCFQSIDNIMNQELKVLEMTNNNSNQIHIVVQLDKNIEKELPILVIQTSNNLTQFQKIRFANQGQERRDIQKVTQAFCLKSLIFLHTASQSKEESIKIYSTELQSIVKVFSSQSDIFTHLSFNSSHVIQWISDKDSQQIQFRLRDIEKVNSLSFMKMLEAIVTLKKLKQKAKKVILVFGAQKSGKTTLCHYLCGHELEHVFKQDLQYYQVEIKNKAVQHYSANQIQKGRIVQIFESQKAILIQFPDWNHQNYFQTQIYILMQQISQTFQEIRAVVAISEQYLGDYDKYTQIMKSLLKMINIQENNDISKVINIVLTKTQDQNLLQMFQDGIQAFGQIDQDVMQIVNEISQGQRIFLFQNEEPQVQNGLEMLDKILQSACVQVEPHMKDKIAQKMKGSEEYQHSAGLLLNQSTFYTQFIDKILTFISHVTINDPIHWSQSAFCQDICHFAKDFGLSFIKQAKKSKSQSFIEPFFNILTHLKLFIEKSDRQINELDNWFSALVQTFAKIGSQSQTTYIKKAFQLFIQATKFPSQFMLKKQNKFNHIKTSFKNNLSSIISQKFPSIIKKITQKNPSLKTSSQYKQISQYLIIQKSTKPKIKKVPMKYQQQKKIYLKDKNQLKLICSLPSSVMKLDLMIEQVIKIKQKGIDKNDLSEIRFYLKECSRICQFHKKYMEALIFLMVIPDFIGINVLLDQLVIFYKNQTTYASKFLFQRVQLDLLDQLSAICRTCVRDSLVKKLAYIKNLINQTNKSLKDIKKTQIKHLQFQLSKIDSPAKYEELLKNKEDLPFFNLKNVTFEKMLNKRADLIKAGILFEESKETKQHFSLMQALNWVVQTQKIPQI